MKLGGVTKPTAAWMVTHCLKPHYQVSVRRVVVVAPASFKPHLTVKPLLSLNG